MTYKEIKEMQESTWVIILTAPNKRERFLFYRSMNGYNNYIIERQIPVQDVWKGTEGLDTDKIALQIGGGGCAFRKDAGNAKYEEYFLKGYKRDEMSLHEVRYGRGREL